MTRRFLPYPAPELPLIPAKAGTQAALDEGKGLMFFVYMTASGKNGTLYVGHCEDIETRIQEHKEKTFGGFTARYGVDKLVWFETHRTREEVSAASAGSRNGSASGSCS
jgi:predicted GIY-YIG superfamily endonuclease